MAHLSIIIRDDSMARSVPSLKQRKTFALLRIAGGLFAAFYLAYVVVVNLAAGVAFDAQLAFCAVVAVAGFGYAAWYLRDLSAVAREERAQSLPPQ